ncbi:hypothetical protein [Phytohabitans rumicis]|uniref:Uncharacterized protein n=1 Tax=Phytohabitans rumicis TaxID=1076125 RepID=A0A6V8LH12_9ACTN|nr:hypothetical protein [Phytohabitans rumicis]GFJ93377.1 hypothetical protein Prum_070190 [Phytohabitans rumicis]
MTSPNPDHMIEYCDDVLPHMLTTACGVDRDLASRSGQDILPGPKRWPPMPPHDQDVLITPFVKEVFDHKPLDTPLDLKTKVTLVVRNSLLEQAHHNGQLTSGITTATEYAAGPLSHFLAARRRNPVDYQGPNPFTGLPARYPRAWACLHALTEAFTDGGRRPLRLPTAPIPGLPTGDEIATAPPANRDDTTMVFGAIDPRFDQHLMDLLGKATGGNFVACTSALSRHSRNSQKLHHILEFLLAHHATILTTNYLIRPT